MLFGICFVKYIIAHLFPDAELTEFRKIGSKREDFRSGTPFVSQRSFSNSKEFTIRGKRTRHSSVIFTGTSHHANQLRRVFDQRTLFITNGAGHNPIVVGTGANISAAVDATLSVSLYNQGQDCAAPNSVLVLQDVYDEFIQYLRKKVLAVSVGHYSNREC